MFLHHFCSFGFFCCDHLVWILLPNAGTLWPILAPPLDEYGWKQQRLCRTTSTSSLPSFIKIHHTVLEKKLNMCSHTYACICNPTPSLSKINKCLINSVYVWIWTSKLSKLQSEILKYPKNDLLPGLDLCFVCQFIIYVWFYIDSIYTLPTV